MAFSHYGVRVSRLGQFSYVEKVGQSRSRPPCLHCCIRNYNTHGKDCSTRSSGTLWFRPLWSMSKYHHWLCFRTWQYSSDAELRGNVIKSFVVNLLSLTFIYALDLLLLPLVQHHPNWFHRNIGWFYQALWLFPVMSVSLYLNVSLPYYPLLSCESL